MARYDHRKNDYIGSKVIQYVDKILRVEWDGLDLSILNITDPTTPVIVRPSINLFLNHVEKKANYLSIQNFVKDDQKTYISDVTIPNEDAGDETYSIWVTLKKFTKQVLADKEKAAGEPVKWSRYPAVEYIEHFISVPFSEYFIV
jgi:hypothetical protein